MVPTITPSLFLPPLGRLDAHPTELISSALHTLRHLYFPVIPSTTVYNASDLFIPKRNIEHSIHDNSAPDSGYASAEEDDEEAGETILDTTEGSNLICVDNTESDVDIIRADPLERAFAIKWVTGFVARSDTWVSSAASDIANQERTDTVDEATSLLSAFIGGDDEDEVALTRTFSFPVGIPNDSAQEPSTTQIHVELNDAPLSKDDHTSVGLQSWGSSIILADRFCLQPSFFSLVPPNEDKPLRILELGAGTGMLSIVASKILQTSNVEVVATDYHPDVLDNLSKNIDTNFRTSSSGTRITVAALDWENPVYESPFDRTFDIILAADVIYHPCHAQWIKYCVQHLLAPPNMTTQSGGQGGGVFWLIIPIRTTGRHEGMDTTVETLFPDATSAMSGAGEPQLAILHREEVGRQGGVGRADEGAYKLFKIGWVY